jgi:hypothetical protein
MAFDPKRIDRLAAKATLLEEQVHALVAELEELAELAHSESAAEPLIAHDPEPIPAPEPVAESEPQAAPDAASVAELEAEPEPGVASEPESRPEAPATNAASTIPEGARLVALNMALSGTPREETARYLRENYDLADPEPLLDDVYAKVGS